MQTLLSLMIVTINEVLLTGIGCEYKKYITQRLENQILPSEQATGHHCEKEHRYTLILLQG